MEKQAFLEEKNLEAIFENNVLKTFKILFSDYLVLKINKYSNYFKTSWLVGLVFTLVITFIFHLILSLSTSYEFNDVVNYFKLLNLTDFSLIDGQVSSKFYLFFFIAKISIGFGIYQLVQAFRKFK